MKAPPNLRVQIQRLNVLDVIEGESIKKNEPD